MKKKRAAVKEQVLKIPAYALKSFDGGIKLNQNENPYDYPADLKEETFRRFRERSWSRYPDFVPQKLRESLAEMAGWKSDGVLVGNGSNELLMATLLTVVGEGTPVAIPSPTFAVYGLISGILGAKVVHIPLPEDLAYDRERLLQQAEEARARLLILCNPNNPTGSVLEEADIGWILDRFPGFLLLDEAYFEFSGRTGLRHLESHPRLIITRTFSKAMGMAGLRIGYLMADPGLAVQIAKAKLPYSVNQFSLIAASVALEHRVRFQPAIESILRERTRLESEMRKIPEIKVYPSAANFFLFEVPASPRELFQDLASRGILVRDVSSYPGLSRCLRVSVGTPEENNRFVEALLLCLGKAEAATTTRRME